MHLVGKFTASIAGMYTFTVNSRSGTDRLHPDIIAEKTSGEVMTICNSAHCNNAHTGGSCTVVYELGKKTIKGFFFYEIDLADLLDLADCEVRNP